MFTKHVKIRDGSWVLSGNIREIALLKTYSGKVPCLVACNNFEFDASSCSASIILDEGVPLDEWCKTKQLSTEELDTIMCKMVCAIAELHSIGIIHGDIKPHNFVIAQDGSLRVIDLGGSRIDKYGFPNGVAYCTYTYCAPECLPHFPDDESHFATYAMDAYGVGATLYFMAFNSHMIPSTDDLDVLRSFHKTHGTVKFPGGSSASPRYLQLLEDLLCPDQLKRKSIMDVANSFGYERSALPIEHVDQVMQQHPTDKRMEYIDTLTCIVKKMLGNRMMNACILAACVFIVDRLPITHVTYAVLEATYVIAWGIVCNDSAFDATVSADGLEQVVLVLELTHGNVYGDTVYDIVARRSKYPRIFLGDIVDALKESPCVKVQLDVYYRLASRRL